jgi:Raf kinase inhibitor-like YbhB/YbcL family protein
MQITSLAFNNNQKIPAKYTCDGQDTNPPLAFSNIPSNTKSLALIVDDPDAPGGDWVHWLVYNLPLDTKQIKEDFKSIATFGQNDFGKTNWGGPCPPSGTHHYRFKLYALDLESNLPDNLTKQDLLEKFEGHILAQAELIGIYQRE